MMLNKKYLLIATVVGTCLLGNAFSHQVTPVAKYALKILTPDHLHWQTLPSGVKVAILSGDPHKAGPFTLRVSLPAHYRKLAHYHQSAAFVTIIKGTAHTGWGKQFVKSKVSDLPAGSFVVIPPYVPHYEWTDQPVTVQIHAKGPWKTFFLKQKGMPKNKVDRSPM